MMTSSQNMFFFYFMSQPSGRYHTSETSYTLEGLCLVFLPRWCSFHDQTFVDSRPWLFIPVSKEFLRSFLLRWLLSFVFFLPLTKSPSSVHGVNTSTVFHIRNIFVQTWIQMDMQTPVDRIHLWIDENSEMKGDQSWNSAQTLTLLRPHESSWILDT